METVTDFISLVSRNAVNTDCSHEIKRHILRGRKALINLDSVLKSRDITLLIKVCIIKAMVFQVVMYRCESWTIKKTEHRRIDALNSGVGEDFFESLGQQGDRIILKEINSEYSLEGLMLKLKLQYFDHLLRSTDSLEKSPDARTD